MKHIRFDGYAPSVHEIMDVVGTTGVNNVGHRLYIRGDYLDKGESNTVDGDFWFIRHSWMKPSQEPQRFPVARKGVSIG